MKNPRIILSLAVVALGLIIAAVPQNTTLPYKLSANEMLSEVYGKVQYFSPDELADLLVNKDPLVQLIDVRDPDEFEKFSLPGAMNIPLPDLLSEQWIDYLNQDVKINIFYSNGTLKANEAWMICRQLGYENNYVLQGGLNHWVETIMNPTAPASTSPDEEWARYDFRKAASAALGGGAVISNENAPAASPVPPLVKRPAKKKALGGC